MFLLVVKAASKNIFIWKKPSGSVIGVNMAVSYWYIPASAPRLV